MDCTYSLYKNDILLNDTSIGLQFFSYAGFDPTPHAVIREKIVRAANCHDDLLEALKALLIECEKIEIARCQTFVACDDARAAIEKASG